MRNKTKKINLSLRDQTTMNWHLESWDYSFVI